MHADTCELSNVLNNFVNLIGELSCVNENENLRVVRRWVNNLKRAYCESRCFTCTGLSLCDGISSINNWKYTQFLDGRGTLKSIAINTS